MNTLNLDSTGKNISSVNYRDADGQTVNLDSSLVVGKSAEMRDLHSLIFWQTARVTRRLDSSSFLAHFRCLASQMKSGTSITQI